MTERVEVEVDETTAARQLRELALADAARALAAWDSAGAYAQAQAEERESAAAS